MKVKLINLVKERLKKKDMEIYKDLNSQANKEFENLLNSQLSKSKNRRRKNHRWYCNKNN